MTFAVVLTVVAAVAGWVAVDAARRQRYWFAWAAFVAVTGGLGLPAWLVVRRRSVAVVKLGALRALVVCLAPLLSLVLLTTLFAFMAVPLVFQLARVDGQAMSPTIADQDRLLVNRIAYRLEQPRRGDIVMMRYPVNPAKAFVMRIIADGGDRVEIIGGRVHVNGQVFDETFVAAESRGSDNWGPQIVPEGSYFVLGDRRNNSADSRHWGYVPRHYVVGKVQVRWCPPSKARTF